MDHELFLALCILWFSTTAALFVFLNMWFANKSESFHPHSVSCDHRHSYFVVVFSNTRCKMDCCVKSISAFVAPRGASSSKYFTCIVCMVSVAGFLGAHRWARIGNGSELETTLSLAGFSALILVALFELDVRPEMFLDDKLMTTGWLIQKLKLQHLLDFDVDDFHDEKFLNFVRNSKEIYHLYDEDQEIQAVQMDESIHEFKYNKATIWSSCHMIGAIAYVIFVTASVLLHDKMSRVMVLITALSFTLFSLMGYLTGNYLYVISYFRCWILTWNPFVKDRDFMKHLKTV